MLIAMLRLAPTRLSLTTADLQGLEHRQRRRRFLGNLTHDIAIHEDLPKDEASPVHIDSKDGSPRASCSNACLRVISPFQQEDILGDDVLDVCEEPAPGPSRFEAGNVTTISRSMAGRHILLWQFMK